MVIGVNILLLLTATAKSSDLMDSSTAYAVYYSTFVVFVVLSDFCPSFANKRCQNVFHRRSFGVFRCLSSSFADLIIRRLFH